MKINFISGKYNCVQDLNVGDVYFDSKVETVEKHGMRYKELSPVGNKGYVIIAITEEKTVLERIEWGNKQIKLLEETIEYDTKELAKDLWEDVFKASWSITYTTIYHQSFMNQYQN